MWMIKTFLDFWEPGTFNTNPEEISIEIYNKQKDFLIYGNLVILISKVYCNEPGGIFLDFW